MSIPFIDLKSQHRRLSSRIRENIDRVLNHGAYVMGPEIETLEQELSSFCGTEHAVACSSGTDALLLSLMALDVGPGDAVLTTPFTFCATAEVISLLQAVPVFVDIDPLTFNLDPSQAAKALQALDKNDPNIHPLPGYRRRSPDSGSGRNSAHSAINTSKLTPRAIISVDLFGLPCDYDDLSSLAEEHGLWLIVDAAQSFGSLHQGGSSCAMGNISCTSFFPAKPLGCYGDGGMCFTSDSELAELLRSLRVHGQGQSRYDNVRLGLNARMDTLQAAVLLAKMEIFPEELVMRGKAAMEYNRLLSGLPGIVTPQFFPDRQSAWAQYSLLAGDKAHRSRIFNRLKAKNIPWAVYYPQPLHLQTAFSYLGYSPGDFPASEDTAARIFSLPMHPYLNPGDQEMIAKVIADL